MIGRTPIVLIISCPLCPTADALIASVAAAKQQAVRKVFYRPTPVYLKFQDTRAVSRLPSVRSSLDLEAADGRQRNSAISRRQRVRALPDRDAFLNEEGAGNAGCATHPRPRAQG